MTSNDPGSIRDRLAVRPSDEASTGSDSRQSGVHEGDFRQTHTDPSARQQHASTIEFAEPLGGPRELTPEESKAAERKVSALFLLSVVGVVGFVFVFIFGEPTYEQTNFQYFTPLLGFFMALALFGIGAGAVLWAKLLMPHEEAVQDRHDLASSAEERAATGTALKEGLAQANLGRRPMLIGSLALGAGALALLPLPFVFGLGRFQNKEIKLSQTGWAEGVRLIRQNGTPVRLGDLVIGGVESVFPDVDHGTKRADSPALLIRMRPDDLELEGQAQEWTYEGHVVYSSICTHLGCPVKLYEQQTHNLFCPCHQSTFDAAHGAKVIFGPAARPLPQLAIAVDEDGYFVATGDFAEPVGPSYWERG